MLNKLLQWLLFSTTFMFASGAAAVAGAGEGAGGGGDAGGGDAGAGGGDGAGGEGDLGGEDDLGLGEEGDGGDLDEGEISLEDEGGQPNAEEQRRLQEEKDTGDLKGLVSKRLVALKKEAPELTAIFQKYPKVQAQIEAAFRRDMGYREIFPTVAEARELREQFPNGKADVDELLNEVGEAEALDRDFYGRDAQGQYPGHQKIIQNMFTDDREAAVAMFKQLPKEWSRLDPESYSEVMGAIVGATLNSMELPGWIADLRDAAKTAKQDQLAGELDKMLRSVMRFSPKKHQPTEDERRLEGQREQFRREQAERKKNDTQRFHNDFLAKSRSLQQGVIRNHPSMKAMLAAKGLTDAKKNEIVEKVRSAIKTHLTNSRAFMGKLRPAYQAGDIQKTLDVQKVAWSYPWILNKYVRAVLATETPNLVTRPNTGARRGAAAGAAGKPGNRGGQAGAGQKVRTEPYKEGGSWFSKEGRRLTTAEILRGAVPAHLLNAAK